MRKFNIKVNGNSYAVEVEEISGAVSSAPAAAPAVTAPKAVVPAPVAAPSGGNKVESPMPGDVRKLFLKNGDAVKTGEKIIVLEAMKMENDIVATSSGVITYAVAEGDHIDSGAVIAYIK